MSAPVVEYIVPPVVEYYIDPSIVVENKYTLYLLFKYDFNENSNLSFCFIRYENGQYYLCIYDEIEDLSYYVRYEIDLKNIITFYYKQIKINIQIDTQIFKFDYMGNYITVEQFWAFPYVQSFNYTYPSQTGSYFIYYPAREMFPAREMSPVIFDARTESPVIFDAKTESSQYNYIPIATAVIRKEIPVATVVQIDTEDDKIARLISDKTKSELEKFIVESFTDLSEMNKRLIFDISKIESSVQWNKFFRGVILSIGQKYSKKNKNLRFDVVRSNLVLRLNNIRL